MSGLQSSITIDYRNETDPNVVVVVTAKNACEQRNQDRLVAWKLLVTQSSVTFHYPKLTQVGSYFYRDGDKIMSGPFPADSPCWEIAQDTVESAPILDKGERFGHPPPVKSCLTLNLVPLLPHVLLSTTIIISVTCSKILCH